MLQAIDLFAGAGGLTLGFKAAGVKTVCAVEIALDRVETFATHTPEANIENVDIQQIDLAPYRRGRNRLWGAAVPAVLVRGAAQAHADERNMVPSFIEAIRTVMPEAFLMENVPGLVVGDRRNYLLSVLREFDSLGYHLTYGVVNAADFGVPQKRRRLFVIGMRGKKFHFPQETHGPNRDHRFVTVGDVLPRGQVGDPNPSRVFYAKRPDIRPSPFDGHIFNGGGRPIDRNQPCHTILASAGGNKTHFFDELNLVPEYHRQLAAGTSPRAGTLPGARRLTVLESAIIQTFPTGMKFFGPRTAQYRQVGDAVPPKLAGVLAAAVVEQLGEGAGKGTQPPLIPRQKMMWS